MFRHCLVKQAKANARFYPSRPPSPLPRDYRYVDMYAADDKLFFEDFAKAFSTLLELGTKDLQEVTA